MCIRDRRYSIQLNEENKDFYQKPYDAASLSNDFKELAYWSNPFHLSSYDEPIITYSVPLFDANGVLRGVMGIELSMEYLKTLFPSNEISPRESLGYMIAEVDETNRLLPLVSKGGYQQRIVKNQESIQLHVKSEQHDIYELEARDTDSDIYCCVQSFSFYNRNTPYEAKNWNLVGLIQEDTLFEFVRSLEKILLFSFLASLLLGTSTMVLMTRKLTKPIIGLSQQVQHFDFSKDIKLSLIHIYCNLNP